MGEHLTGSVGIVRGGVKRSAPGNTATNQQTVIGLLAKIPAAQGGMQEQWTTVPPAVVDGICPPELGEAIWNFQSFWKSKGTFKNIDGVVDPGGNTLRVLNTLALGGQAQKSGPNGIPPANTTNLNKLIGTLRQLFPRPSRWTLTNAPGFNVGIEVGVGIGIGAGQLDVQEDGSKEEQHLTYVSGGVNMGISPAGPFTFTMSTRDMRSATSLPYLSGMGRIFSRQAALSFEDMEGGMVIFGVTGAGPDKFGSDIAEAVGQKMLMGAAFNLFMFGISASGRDAMMRLAQTGNVFTGIMNAVQDCKAIAMSAGECVGYDLSIGMALGTATGYFGKIEPPSWVTDNANKAKPYFDAYESGKKNMEDAIKDKLKEWSPW